MFVKKRSTQGYHRLESFKILANQRLANARIYQVDSATSNRFRVFIQLKISAYRARSGPDSIRDNN